jgi:hypothetical protein
VTGNTIVDALDLFHAPMDTSDSNANATRRTVLMTLHRRESWGSLLASLCDVVRDVVLEHRHARLVVPVHPNPVVATTVKERLGGWPRIELLPPLPYRAFVRQLRLAQLIITDSGGVGIVRCRPRALPNRPSGRGECGLHISNVHRLRAPMAQFFDGPSCFRRIPAVRELVSASESWGTPVRRVLRLASRMNALVSPVGRAASFARRGNRRGYRRRG